MKEGLQQPTFLIPSGELEKRVMPFLEASGIQSRLPNKRSLRANTNMGVSLVQVRPSDIPTVLGLGLPDVIGGIAGSDSFLEQTGELYPGVEVPVYAPGERRPRIAVAATRQFIEDAGGSASLKDLSGRMITTTLPNMARSALEDEGMETFTFPEGSRRDRPDAVMIFPVGGKTEALPLLADSSPAVLDVVDSGATLEANGLEVIQDIHEVSIRLVVASGIKAQNLEVFDQIEALLRAS